MDLRAAKTSFFGNDYGVEAVFQVLNAFDRANFDAPIGNLGPANFGVEDAFPVAEHQRALPPERTGPPLLVLPASAGG